MYSCVFLLALPRVSLARLKARLLPLELHINQSKRIFLAEQMLTIMSWLLSYSVFSIGDYFNHLDLIDLSLFNK